MLIRLRTSALLAPLGSLVFVLAPALPALAQDHTVGVHAKSDPALTPAPDATAFDLGALGSDWVFATGGQFVELPSGVGRLVGVLARISDPRQRLLADLTFDTRIDNGDPTYPPPGSPLLELLPAAYTANGGTVDPNSFHYWDQVDGTLTGLEDLRGAKYTVAKRGPAFQCGAGANGRNGLPGASGLLTLALQSQPIAGPALPANVDGESHLDLEPKFVLGVQESKTDPTVAPATTEFAFMLTTLGMDWKFVAGGQLEEQGDGTARLTGVIARPGFPTKRFFVDGWFASRTNSGEAGHAPSGSPKKELLPLAYVENGGPVDANHWYYYETFGGTLTGLGDYAGVKYSYARRGPAFQVGVGANGKNLAWGGSGWLDLTRTSAPPNSRLPQLLVGDINVDFLSEESECATEAMAVPGLALSGGHALFLNNLGTDFVFTPGGQFTEFADGSASLTGLVQRTSDPLQRFLVSVQFVGRLDPFDPGYPPPMSPKLELAPSAYVQNGGSPIDTDAWHYYQVTVGTLIGQASYAGAVYTIDRMGPAFQVGLGANGKNLNYGGSGWLNAYRVAPPSDPNVVLPLTTFGDFNLDMDDQCDECPDEAQAPLTATDTPGGHALTIARIARTLLLLPGSRFEEYDDGTARLLGTVAGMRAPGRRFAVDLRFSGRVEPGSVGHAPSGSPKKELYDWLYTENGGVIDTDSWHYYLYTEGTLTGELLMAGAVLEIERMGPAFQVGLGASGKNLKFGASGWLNVRTLSQPTSGNIVLPLTTFGDINIDTECP